MTTTPSESVTPPSGPDCYRRAAGLVQQAATEDMPPEVAAHLIATAQVYATLAQAFAIASARTISPQEQWGGHTVKIARDDLWDRILR